MSQMNNKVIGKMDVTALLERLLGEYEVYAPVKRDDLAVFDRIHSGEEALLHLANTAKPPKELMLPQSEVLYTYSTTNGTGLTKTPQCEDNPRLLFGVRPCDARSFYLLDKVFNGDRYKDVYYLNRRANTIVASIGCINPRTTCFCTSVGGGPFSEEGTDLLFIDIVYAYVVKAVTEGGAKALQGAGLEDAGEDDLAWMNQMIRDAEASMEPRLAIDGLKEKLDKMFDDPMWETLTEKCLGCGVCTYLCPTCHCFDIVDEVTESHGERIRVWDSCQFRRFTQQASGFNPRPTTKERLRQRIMHKFSYFLDSYREIGCVGCGRCLTECPVNLDIREVLTDIQMEKVAG